MHHRYGRLSICSVESSIIGIILYKRCLPFSFKINRIDKHHNGIWRKLIYDGGNHLIRVFLYPAVHILHNLICLIREVCFVYFTTVIGLCRQQKIIGDILCPVFLIGHPDGICSIDKGLFGPFLVQIALHFIIPVRKLLNAKC